MGHITFSKLKPDGFIETVSSNFIGSRYPEKNNSSGDTKLVYLHSSKLCFSFIRLFMYLLTLINY